MSGPNDTLIFDRALRDAWALLKTENWDAALGAFQNLCKRPVENRALSADAWYGAAATHLKLNDTAEATVALERAHELSPGNAKICTTYAQVLLKSATVSQAISVLRAGLAAAPHDSDLLRLAADAFDTANDIRGSIEVCETLLRLEPQNPLVHLKLGRLKMVSGEYEAALKHYRNVLSVDQNNVAALDGLSDIFRIQGPRTEARKVLLKRAELSQVAQEKSAFQLKAALTQPVISKDTAEIDEARAGLTQTLAAGPNSPYDDPWKLGLGPCFYLGYQARDDRKLQEALAKYYLKATPSLSEIAPHVGRSTNSSRRLRVGIVSNFLSKHTIGYLSYGLIAGLDRQRFDVRLFRTPRAIPDPQTPRFLAAAPCVDLPPDLRAARKIISDEELDILHFPEVGMDHFTYFLAFARLATLQTVTWGHPVTTGLPTLDLFLSVDKMEPAHAEKHYSEKLVRLKSLSINVEQPPEMELDSAHRILSPRQPAYLCAQSLYKIHPEFDPMLARILELDTDARVYFFSHGPNADSELKIRFERSLGKNIARVKFLPRVTPSKFLQIVKEADVALDVPHWSGGKTSLDAFAMGTPIAHKPGEFMRGRHTTAFYHKLGISDAVAEVSETYAILASRLVHDGDFKEHVTTHIVENRHNLFGDVAAIREIESVWISALQERT